MIPLLRRAATSAGLAACGWSTLLAAQSTEVAVPERAVLRQPPTPAPAPAPAPGPIVQQSPNGLYRLSITDAGIELHGPKGIVKINEQGIQIGGPGAGRINIESGGKLILKGTDEAQLLSGKHMSLQADGHMVVSGFNMQLYGTGEVRISGGATSSLTAPSLKLGCTSGKPAARTEDQITTNGTAGIISGGSARVTVC